MIRDPLDLPVVEYASHTIGWFAGAGLIGQFRLFKILKENS